MPLHSCCPTADRKSVACIIATDFIAALLVFFLLLAPQVRAAEPYPVLLKYTLGFDYSTGEYGAGEDTDIYFIPLSIEADFYPYRVIVTIPVVFIDGVAVDSPGSLSSRSQGLGQISGRVSYLIAPVRKWVPWFEVSAKLSAHTETDKSLGSGMWGFSVFGDAFKQYGRVTGFTRFGRTFYTSSGLGDRFFTSIGASFRFTDRLSGGLAYDWFEASSDGVSDTEELLGFAMVKVSERWSIGPYGLLGLSKYSPDYGVGLSISFKPPRP